MAGKSIVVANWKMNPPTWRQAKALFEATKKVADSAPSVSAIIAPPALYLAPLTSLYRGKRVAFAAQHAHSGMNGAYTGEISMAQVADAKAQYVLIGHAERRALGESNDDTRRKVAAALLANLTPILCVGERTRSGSGEHFTFVKEQLITGFGDVEEKNLPRMIVAYEPVWAIGGDKAMTPREMHEMAIFIRKTIVNAKSERGMNIKILYGGAIDDANARAMINEGDVAGLLVGRASTDAKEFALLIHAIAGKKSV